VVKKTLKNMSSSVGVTNGTQYGKIKNVPNHQPEHIYSIYLKIVVIAQITGGHTNFDTKNWMGSETLSQKFQGEDPLPRQV